MSFLNEYMPRKQREYDYQKQQEIDANYGRQRRMEDQAMADAEYMNSLLSQAERLGEERGKGLAYGEFVAMNNQPSYGDVILEDGTVIPYEQALAMQEQAIRADQSAAMPGEYAKIGNDSYGQMVPGTAPDKPGLAGQLVQGR